MGIETCCNVCISIHFCIRSIFIIIIIHVSLYCILFVLCDTRRYTTDSTTLICIHFTNVLCSKLYLFGFIYFEFECSKWCRLFQRRALSTKFDICVFIWITLFALISHYVDVLISVMSSVLDNLYFVALLSDLLFVASSVLVTELLA